MLEILVAFAVLSLSLGVIFQIYAGGARGTVRSDLHSRAAIIAASQLSRVGRDIELVEGEQSGKEGAYTWNVEITPYMQENATEESSLLQVAVNVENRQDHALSYAVTTLRFANQ